MYKTVRHGENSLQYTILPQNDDFRMDCKLSSAESSCSSSTIKARKQAKSKRPRRRTFFAYLGLIFICTVIVGAVLIPFLVSAECLPNPTDWFLKSKAAFMRNHFQRFEYNTNTHKNNHNNINNKNNNKTDNKNNIVNTNANNHDMNVENLGKHVQIINNNNSMDTIILHLNKTYNNNNNNKSNKNEINMLTSTIASVTKMMNADNKKLVTEVYSLEGDLSTTIINNNDKEKMANYMHSHMNVADTIHSPLIDNNNNNNNDTSKIIQAPAPDLPAQSAMIMQHQQQQQQQQQQLINNNNDNMPQMNAFVNSPHAPVASSQQFTVTNVQQSQTPAAMPTITTRIIQVPLLKSTAKKPFIPPVLVKSKSYNDLAQHNINADKNNNNNNNFKMNAHDIEKTAIEATKATQDDVIKHDINNINNNNNNNNNNKKWLKAHWPYMDPTTYFQWTGYKAEDSVLLPAILGIVLLVVIIILALLMTAGFKRRLISVVKKRKRNDIEEAGAEDNATLLTSTNLSDED